MRVTKFKVAEFLSSALLGEFLGRVEMGVYGLGRPADPNVKYFQRQLGEAERATLLVAGKGDMSAGFLEIIDTYRHFYNLGLRPSMAREAVSLILPPADD